VKNRPHGGDKSMRIDRQASDLAEDATRDSIAGMGVQAVELKITIENRLCQFSCITGASLCKSRLNIP